MIVAEAEDEGGLILWVLAVDRRRLMIFWSGHGREEAASPNADATGGSGHGQDKRRDMHMDAVLVWMPVPIFDLT